MRKALLALIIVLLMLLTAALASPLLALQSLRDALAARDDSALPALLDSGQLRANVSSRVRVRYSQLTGNPLIQPVIDRLLTPEGLIAAICDGGVIKPSGTPPGPCAVHSSLNDVRFESPDRFSAALTESDEVVATLVMDRVGLRWKLADLVLPSGVYDRIKNSVLN